MSDLHRDPGRIPDRWLNCPRKSLGTIVDKFIAFKTPLNHRFSNQIKPANKWDPAMVFDITKSLKLRIGLWIDLTNTSRYYDPEEVKSGYEDGQEVAYVKLKCAGHDETPTVDQTADFINICHKFISNKPLQIIGVHCTHGFNRTGFLIVAYLVEKLDYGVACALQIFAKSRPPGIYKGEYIKELYRRYDEVEDATGPPLRPTWCFDMGNGNNGEEVDDDVDEDQEDESYSGQRPDYKKRHNSSRDRGSKRKRNRRDGRRPQFMAGISGVAHLSDHEQEQQLQRIAREMCHWEQDCFPGSQPVSMDLKNVSLLTQHPYRVSWKADGTRYMMLIIGENQVYFLDRDNNVFQVYGLRFVHRKDRNKHITDTLLDGEMVIDKHEGRDIPRYLVYDIIRVNNIDVTGFPFHPHRLDCIEADIIQPRYHAIREGKLDKRGEPFSVRGKTFFPVEKARSFLSEKFNQQLTHEPDGLIFQPSREPYTSGPCLSVLKWKPHSLNSVDFRLKIVTEDNPGMLRQKIGYLYVGGEKKLFAKIKYSKAIKDLNNKIIECKYENNDWVFMRERTDKSFPNALATARSVCESIQHPVTKEHLLDVVEKHRFRDDEELMPPPQSRFR